MKTQTFWSRYKVLITGGLMALFTALAPLLVNPSKEWDYKALIVAGCIGLASWLGREARGKSWTMGGQIAAALMAFSSSYEGQFDVPRIVIAVAMAFFSVPLSPIKLSTYESATPIIEAKEEAKEIKVERDIAAKIKGKGEAINLP